LVENGRRVRTLTLSRVFEPVSTAVDPTTQPPGIRVSASSTVTLSARALVLRIQVALLTGMGNMSGVLNYTTFPTQKIIFNSHAKDTNYYDYSSKVTQFLRYSDTLIFSSSTTTGFVITPPILHRNSHINSSQYKLTT
jgi:hypothetical protein